MIKLRNKLSLEEAINICSNSVKAVTEVENVPVALARERVTAHNICAGVELPSFDRSLVDGYAVTRVDYEQLLVGLPLEYEVMDTIPAGKSHDVMLSPGKTVRIMTGAILPRQTAVVIKQEYAVATGNNLVRLTAKAGEKSWCERSGSILSRGQTIAAAGEALDEEKLELLASVGVYEVPVFRRPRVYIISTGSELVMSGATAQWGQIFNSNFTMLTAKLQKQDCEVIKGRGDLKDNLSQIAAEVQKGMAEADVVIITGGASDGDFDLVPAALAQTGCNILYHQLDLKPGAHSTVAKRDNCLLFNLPGNPGGGGLLFEVLICPVLRKLKGMYLFARPWFQIRLAQGVSGAATGRRLCKAQLINTSQGPQAVPWGRKMAKGVAPLVLDIAPGQGAAGDLVKALLI